MIVQVVNRDDFFDKANVRPEILERRVSNSSRPRLKTSGSIILCRRIIVAIVAEARKGAVSRTWEMKTDIISSRCSFVTSSLFSEVAYAAMVPASGSSLLFLHTSDRLTRVLTITLSS